MYILRRRHRWQLPLHPLQMVGMGVYILLVTIFYLFVGPFVGNRIASIIVLAIHSSLAVSVMGLFIRCTATDPSDKTRQHRNRNQKRKKRKKSPSSKLTYGFLLQQMVVRMERNILNKCIRRKYLHLQQQQHPSNLHLQPLLLPFPASLVTKDDYPPNNDNDNNNSNDNDKDELSFCFLCNFQVQKHSKHCRICNRCVDGFDHHCRWLNNCVGRKNYTTFILLMISLLLMLLMDGGSSIAVFIRCFADKKGIEQELATQFHLSFRRGQGLLIAFSVFLFVITAYGSAALSQLLFFHILLIRKILTLSFDMMHSQNQGMRTYDYILAMKEANQFNVSKSFSDSDFSSDDNSEPESPTRPIVMSQFVCNGQTTIPSPGQFTVRIDPESSNTSMSNPNPGFRPSIDPWKLIQMSKEKAFLATEKAKEKLAKEKQIVGSDSLKSLPLEMKSGPLVKPERDLNTTGLSLTPLISKGRFPGSPGRLSSPRRRFSGSPATLSVVSAGMPNQKYRNNFDLKITEVSRDLESYISRQVLCTVVKDGTEASPR